MNTLNIKYIGLSFKLIKLYSKNVIKDLEIKKGKVKFLEYMIANKLNICWIQKMLPFYKHM